MFAVLKKELKILFFSPMGYIAISALLLVFCGIFYVFTVVNRSVDIGAVYYGTAMYGLPIVIAILTMKSFAEEKNKETDQILFMAPRSSISIVLGKIFAIMSVIVLSLVLTLIYCAILSIYGNINWKIVLMTILGFLLISMAYTSFGVLVSTLTENQVISAIVTLIFLLLPLFFTFGNGALSYLLLIDFFVKIPVGIVSAREILCLSSFTIMCVVLELILLKRRKMYR